ncbi:outer membrane protein assembly factor BamB family protein, partial [Actinomadura sediminis]
VPLVRGAADDVGAAGGGAGAAAPERPAGPPPEGAPGWRRAFTGKDLGLDVAGGLLLVNASGSTDESVDNDVRALDPRDGTVVWERTGTVARTGKDTARDDVYLTDVKGERVRAVRASSGRTRWTYDFVDDFEYFEGPGDLTASGPVVCFRISRHGRDPAEQIGALGRDDGRRRWTSEPMEDLHAVTAGGGLVVAATATSLAALDVSTGKRRWRRAMEYGDHLIAGRDTVYACDRLGTLHALRAADGGTAWTHRNAAAWTARLGGGRVYLEGADGEVLALDAATGRTAWSRRVARLEDVPRAQSTAFRLAGGILYAACSDGTLYALDAADGRVRWIYAAEEIRRGAPASVAGLVHVATADGHVRAIVPPDSPGG